MAAEALENFQVVVTSFVAVAGAAMAGLGLWTWKQQIRWQQGRGLAVSTMQSFFDFKRTALDYAKLGYFHYVENDLPEQRTAAHQQAIERATTFCGKLEASLTELESNVAEAMIVWDEDFEQILSSVADVEHIVRCAAQTGAAAMNPNAPPHQRSSSASLHEAFKGDFFGLNEDRRSVGSRLADVQQILSQKLKDKKLR